MRKQKRFYLVSMFIALIITIIIIENFTNFKKAYIQFFNKNAVIEHYNSGGKLDCEFITYLNGKIHIKAFFKNGLRNGWDIEYYSNGQIKNERFFEMGKETGVENQYYENGKLDYKANWKITSVMGASGIGLRMEQ